MDDTSRMATILTQTKQVTYDEIQDSTISLNDDVEDVTISFESGCEENTTISCPNSTAKSEDSTKNGRHEYKKLKQFSWFLGVLGSIVFVSFSIYLVIMVLLHKKNTREYENQSNQQNQNQNQTPSLHHPILTSLPSFSPSISPSLNPTSLPPSSIFPSYIPTATPTSIATYVRTSLSTTQSPSLYPTVLPTEDPNVTETTTFYAIGDVPYSDIQHHELRNQILALPGDAEFLIHVGDLRHSGSTIWCTASEYTSVAETLRLSPVPVFIIVGDNDWNDCPNPVAGLQHWQNSFRHFDSRYWNHTFNVTHQPGRPDNFAFVHKQTLFVGLNLVGGNVLNRTEWTTRLSDQAEWTIKLIQKLLSVSQPNYPRVVIFGHANPKSRHADFFQPLTKYIRQDLQNSVPVLYLCGDRHRWLHQESYFNQPSFTRIMLTGKTDDPPLKVLVHATGKSASQSPSAFQYDRMLPVGHPALTNNGTSTNINDDDAYSEEEQDDLFGTDDAFLTAQLSVVTIYNQTTDF